MFALSMNAACLLYLSLTLGILLIVWLGSHFFQKNTKLEISENRLQTCEFCHFSFLAEKGKVISKCPQCHSFLKDP